MRLFSLFLLALPLSVACSTIDDDTELLFDINDGKADHIGLVETSCIDAPGYEICGLEAADIFHGMDVEFEDLDPIAAVGNLPYRTGTFDGVSYQCLLTGQGIATCTVMPSPILNGEDAVYFLISLWNTPGSTMSGKLQRFQFRSWPDSIPTGNWGATANRTLGPYTCRARLAFVGNTWTVDVDASDSAICYAKFVGAL